MPNLLDCPPRGTRIKLSEVEVRLAKFLAEARYRVARANGVPDGKIGPQSCASTDLEGVCGELAFSRIFNVYPDLQLAVRPPFDVIVAGLRVDVKFTKYANGRLLAVQGKKSKGLPIDCFALITGDIDGWMTYRGVCAGETLLRDCNLRSFGHGFGYALDQCDLVEFSSLFKMDTNYGEREEVDSLCLV